MKNGWSSLRRILVITVGLLGAIAPVQTAYAAGYSTWNSHDPEICLDQVFDYYYAQAITDAWIVRGDEAEARRLLQEYADSVRCNRDLGMVDAAYVYVPDEGPSTTVTISTSTAAADLSADDELASNFPELKVSEVLNMKELAGEWLEHRKFREDIEDPASVPIGIWGGAPHFCIGNVMVWQDRARWMIGQWNARHRGTCFGSVSGRLRFNLRGDYVEPSAALTGQDVYRSVHRINAPFGGSWDLTETFRARPSYVIRWSPRSTYTFEVLGSNSRSSQTTSLSMRPINKKGREYPNISVASRGPVPFDDIPPTFSGQTPRLPPGQWDTRCRQHYANNGWPYPVNLMPVSYQNHHVRPLRWNGSNAGANCYRLEANHHYFYSVWWQPGSNFETPISN